MRRRILSALAILFGESIPHEWTVCPNVPNVLAWDWPAGTGSPPSPQITYTVAAPDWPGDVPQLASEIESRLRLENVL